MRKLTKLIIMKKFYALFLLFSFVSITAIAQVSGDYRTSDGGFNDWSDAIWDRYNGSSWVSGQNGPATIPSGNTCTILSGGAVVIGGSVTNNGTITVNDQLYIFGGTLTNNGTVTNTSAFQVASGSYIHNQNGGSLPANTTWDAGGTLEIKGVTTTKPSNWPGSVGTLVINCSGLSSAFTLAGGFETKADLTITNTGSSEVQIISGGGTNATVKGDLSIEASGKLKVRYNAALTVEGSVSNTTNANLVLESTSSGTGSLIFTSGTPNATTQLYVSSGAWHLIGSPVATAPATTFLSGYMQRWHEYDGSSAGYWEVIETNPDLSRGYGDAFYFISSSYTAEFTGTLIGSKVSIGSLGNTTNDGTDGWHCLANPFPSSIDWGSCTATNVSAAEIYNGSSYTTRATLAAMQGFFVQVADGKTGSVDFETAAKTHNNVGIGKNARIALPHLLFLFSDDINKSKDELIIQMAEDATFDYETKYDARKIEGNPKAGEIFAEIHEGDYACMLGIPDNADTYSIPVGFKKGDASNYTIDLSENTLAQNMDVVLKDNETGELINLKKQNSYTFSANANNNARFVLLLSKATGVDDLNSMGVKIWSDANDVHIRAVDAKYDIKVYSIDGKEVKSFKSLSDEFYSFALNVPKGMYIIEYISKNNSYSQKIIK
jgi:hypothetical protein